MGSVYIEKSGLVGSLFPSHVYVTLHGKKLGADAFVHSGSFVKVTAKMFGKSCCVADVPFIVYMFSFYFIYMF